MSAFLKSKDLKFIYCALFCFVIAFIPIFFNYVKKIKFKDTEIEFKDINKEIKTVAFDLLEKTFPALSNITTKEINNRITSWTNNFIAKLENSELKISDNKLLYSPDFQFVFQKVVENVGRYNNKIHNDLFIELLLIRLSSITKIEKGNLLLILDDSILNVNNLSENDFKILTVIYLFNKTFGISNIEEYYQKIIPLWELFFENTDFNAQYVEFLISKGYLLDSGNILMLPKKNDLGIINEDFFMSVLKDKYSFFKEITPEEEQTFRGNNTISKLIKIFENKLTLYTIPTHVQLIIEIYIQIKSGIKIINTEMQKENS